MTKEYIINENNTVRYVLGKYENNPLIVFGINPSKATTEKNDTTISIVEKNCQNERLRRVFNAEHISSESYGD